MIPAAAVLAFRRHRKKKEKASTRVQVRQQRRMTQDKKSVLIDRPPPIDAPVEVERPNEGNQKEEEK